MHRITVDFTDMKRLLEKLLLCEPMGPDYPIFLIGSTKLPRPQRYMIIKKVMKRVRDSVAIPYMLRNYGARADLGIIFWWEFNLPDDMEEIDRNRLETAKKEFDYHRAQGILPFIRRGHDVEPYK